MDEAVGLFVRRNRGTFTLLGKFGNFFSPGFNFSSLTEYCIALRQHYTQLGDMLDLMHYARSLFQAADPTLCIKVFVFFSLAGLHDSLGSKGSTADVRSPVPPSSSCFRVSLLSIRAPLKSIFPLCQQTHIPLAYSKDAGQRILQK